MICQDLERHMLLFGPPTKIFAWVIFLGVSLEAGDEFGVTTTGQYVPVFSAVRSILLRCAP